MGRIVGETRLDEELPRHEGPTVLAWVGKGRMGWIADSDPFVPVDELREQARRLRAKWRAEHPKPLDFRVENGSN